MVSESGCILAVTDVLCHGDNSKPTMASAPRSRLLVQLRRKDKRLSWCLLRPTSALHGSRRYGHDAAQAEYEPRALISSANTLARPWNARIARPGLSARDTAVGERSS